jgi:hypothetical protein
MAFESKKLSVLAYANGFTLWHYTTADAAADVDTQGYFNGASDMLTAGDMVICNAGMGMSPEVEILHIKCSGPAGVSVRDVVGKTAPDQTPISAAALRDEMRDELARLREANRELVEALKPFSEMAGELFARNWNDEDVVAVLDNPGDPHRITASDFFRARAVLAKHGVK